MKYLELEKLLKKHGCQYLHDSVSGFPVWFSPITNKKFKMSSLKTQEVGNGVLLSILKNAGLNPLLAAVNKNGKL